MSCENCEYYESKENLCWYDPANPKKVTQPEAKCDYEAERAWITKRALEEAEKQ